METRELEDVLETMRVLNSSLANSAETLKNINKNLEVLAEVGISAEELNNYTISTEPRLNISCEEYRRYIDVESFIRWLEREYDKNGWADIKAHFDLYDLRYFLRSFNNDTGDLGR